MRVCLTSIPPRFKDLELTVLSLIKQTVQVERIVIFVPRTFRRFNEGFDLSRLHWIQKYGNVEFRVVEEDYGPATKFAYIQDDNYEGDWICCDDDQIYPPDWVFRFIEARRRHPTSPLTNSGFFIPKLRSNLSERARFKGISFRIKRFLGLNSKYAGPWSKSGYVDIAEGWSGICFRKSWVSDVNLKQIPEHLAFVDDIWISACLTANGHRPWLVAPGLAWNLASKNDERYPLKIAEFAGRDRNQLNTSAICELSTRFNIWSCS